MVVALVGCTGVKPVHDRVHATPLAGTVLVVPGETMEFRIALRGVTMGEVETAIGKPGDVGGKHAVIVRSRGKTDGILKLFGDITWELTSTIDLARGEPIEDREEAWVEFAGQKDHADERHQWADDDRRHDIHSAVGVVRGWHSKPGDRSEQRGGDRRGAPRRRAVACRPGVHRARAGHPLRRHRPRRVANLGVGLRRRGPRAVAAHRAVAVG